MKPHATTWGREIRFAATVCRWAAPHSALSIVLIWLGALVLPGCGTNTERSVAGEGAATSMPPGDTMRIHFERAGGFAGMRLTVDIQTDTLPQEDQLRLRQLVEDADFFALPAELRDTSAAPDQFTYTVAIETPDRHHTVETTENAAGPLLRPLLEWLTRAARRRT